MSTLEEAVAEWGVQPAPWQGHATTGAEARWSNTSAADLMQSVYLAGASIRQTATIAGFGYEWTRRVLADRGVLRSRNDPTMRLHLRFDEEGAMRWGYEVSTAGPAGGRVGEPLWRVTMFGMPTVREVLVRVGALDPERPAGGWLPRDRAFRMEGGLPSVVKLMSADEWWISQEECRGAIRALSTPPPGGLTRLVAEVLRDGGWKHGASEVEKRSSEIRGLAALLWEGSSKHGLVVH